MLSSNWTPLLPFTLGQLLFRKSRYILSRYLLLMTRVTKMSISPTKPLSYWTTKTTFKRYILLSMLLAVSHLNWTARWTYQLLWIEFLVSSLVHRLCTVLAASEVRISALETLKVSIDSHSKLSLVFIKRRFRISQLLIFLLMLML